MIRNYITSAFRFFLRNKGFTVINIIGLALGIACTVLIFLYVYDEMRFDRYHEHWRRIYMVCTEGKMEGIDWKTGWTTPPMGPNMENDFPEIEYMTRLCLWYMEFVFKYEKKLFVENYVVGTDSTVFDIFTIPFIQGDPKTALNRPNTAVITESTAKKYFGDEDPIGKVIYDEGYLGSLEITGIVEDQPVNSHFYFDIMFSIISIDPTHEENWFNHTFQTYLLLPEKYDPEKLESKFDEFIYRHIGPVIEREYGISIDEMYDMGYYYRYWLLPLKEVHLSQMVNEQHGTKTFIYILSVIGLFILLIACINYMNLSTAMASIRSKEVGIRKILGSTRSQITQQYVGESVMLSLVALCLGMLLVEFSIPYFNAFTGKQIGINYFSNMLIIPGLLLFAILTGILSGFYPSIVLASSKPVIVLKGIMSETTQKGKSWLRNILVVFQFTVCIIILIGTIIVTKQLLYMQNKNPGLDSEQVLVLHRTGGLWQKPQTFKQELLINPSIQRVAFAYNTPARHHNPNGHHLYGNPDHLNHTIHVAWGDMDYISALGLEIIRGRDFNPDMSTDYYASIINESAVDFLELEDPLSARFDIVPWPAIDSIDYNIIGVVKDFHFQSLHHEIEQWILYPLREDIAWYASYIMIRMNTESFQSTLRFIKDKWDEFTGEYPFEYSFLNQDFDNMYQKEMKARKMFTIFSIFAMIIACMGLLGLASFTANQKTKEIGIRKAMGSKAFEIQMLLSKQFSKWILVAVIFAWSIAWYLMSRWLENFAYRIDMPWWVFIVSGLFALLLALLTVSYNTFHAAGKNPVDALRYE